MTKKPYIRARIQSMITKTEPFEDTVFRLKKSELELGLSKKQEFSDLGPFRRVQKVKKWNYEHCDFHQNLVAIGQPSGWISIINLDTKATISEFQAFEGRDFKIEETENFRWTRMIMNSKIIVASGSWDQPWTRQERGRTEKGTQKIEKINILNYGGKLACNLYVRCTSQYFLDEDAFYIVDNSQILSVKISDILDGKDITYLSGMPVCKTPFFRRPIASDRRSPSPRLG